MNISTKIPQGEDVEWAVRLAEQFAEVQKLDVKDALHLRLLTEETGEISVNLPDEPEGTLSLEGDETGCIVKLTLENAASARKTEFDAKSISGGIAGKISCLLGLSYEETEAFETELMDIGVRKASESDFEEMGLSSSGTAYVWTDEAYNSLSFDKMNEDDASNWIEISHSIIANIADYIRIFVFKDRSELTIRVSFAKTDEEKPGKYVIDPELSELYKIPVAKSRFQIKIVQLLYGKLPDKQKSTDSFRVTKLRVPCDCAPKGYVSLLRYTPVSKEEEVTPAVLFMHGGAFMLPALPYHYRIAETIVSRIGCSVFFMLQDLAPKCSMPLPVREAYEVYTYLLFHGNDLKIDTDHIAAMGDSSGGTMTAALALLARDHCKTPLSGQVMLYPSIGLDHETQSMKEFTDVPVVNAEAIRSYHRLITTESDADEYYFHPASAASHEDLPPAYIETAEYDALRDEGIYYAELLKENGCEVVLNKTKGTVHAFDMAKDSRVLAAAMDKRIEFLGRVLGNRE